MEKSENSIEILKRHRIKSIRTPSGMAVLRKPSEAIDEGKHFRIAEMHVVDKGNVVKVEERGSEKIRIDYKNGDWFEIEVCKEAQTGSKKMILHDVKSYLDANYSNKIKLDDLAERFFINKYYLVRMFKEQFGVSVMDYLLELRITEAKNLLRFTNMTANEIGLKVGIGDQYYFSRVFKKAEGMSAREYRNQWR